ncbi:hypothetical protein [Phaeobacter gallaeciensis]|uniref:hypothetical protein n=1 Tax=Phaeobacter gallaeciensis TaxID=60890 RepID=UPI00237F85E7|nr:hypothetical protein [Phaeobacter gallaeciensis]MDE4142859.1 hypothetical protein [Phaeobacter gallaeciensis]MDE4151318.1 hypothetical protein [Phaeobacter gallaeciensis]MDE4155515.1 hypothetical protein [Phaeobacter gallaeciensis]MDE4230940.1 hypothetical protein [Phaeobacter gallaeciensis]MDE4264208.1 hypothetical protein [Phaeobacter gallaeciensis]
MLHLLARLATVAAISIGPASISATKAAAQSYPIDCAILLCLSGGWPASVPCTRARAEFIRRITPWPVEPPLQIWRCPMAASYQGNQDRISRERIYDTLFNSAPQPQVSPQSATLGTSPRTRRPQALTDHAQSSGMGNLQLAQGADIDISGSAFDFVRSIRVYNVRYAHQYNAGSEGGCMRTASIQLGDYGPQGAFSWERSSPEALPAKHVGLDGWGQVCPPIYHRSVFVDWRDARGTYGFEQVNY